MNEGELRYVAHSKTCKPLDCARQYDQRYADAAGAKPAGLWLSVIGEDGIDHWLQKWGPHAAQEYPDPRNIFFNDDARILHLCTAADIDLLNADFGNYSEAADWARLSGRARELAVRWHEVAQRYDAVMTHPYCVERSANHWYNEWEVQSGCVWNLNVLKCCASSRAPSVTETTKK
jgi:hypothetical protein